MVSVLFDSIGFTWGNKEYIHLSYPCKQQNVFPSEQSLKIFSRFLSLNNSSAGKFIRFYEKGWLDGI